MAVRQWGRELELELALLSTVMMMDLPLGNSCHQRNHAAHSFASFSLRVMRVSHNQPVVGVCECCNWGVRGGPR